MRKVIAPAAGQSGAVTALAAAPAPLSPDEAHRQSAVEKLAEHLAKGAALLARCERLANTARGDRLGPIYAAARLMNADAQVAKALAHVALVESRRRTIIETIQPPAPKNAGLNSRFSSVEENDNALLELERRIEAIAAASDCEKEQQEDEAASGAI